MVIVGTNLLVGDNSGCKKVKCIKILGSSKKKARLGDYLIVSVVKATPNKKIKEHEVRKVILIRSKTRTLRSNGLIISFLKNVVLLVDSKCNPVGTRILGSVTKELREKNLMKIVSMSSSVV